MGMKTGGNKKSRAAARKAKRHERIAATTVEVNVTFRHMEPTPALKEYAERKLAHLGRILKRPAQAHLILTVDKYRQCGEVIFKTGRLTVAAKEEHTDLYAVIDLIADKLARQLKRHVEKSKDRKLRAPSTPQVLAAVEEA